MRRLRASSRSPRRPEHGGVTGDHRATTDPASRRSSEGPASSIPTSPASRTEPGSVSRWRKQTIELHEGTIGWSRHAGRRGDLRRCRLRRPVASVRAQSSPGGRRGQHPSDAGRAPPGRKASTWRRRPNGNAALLVVDQADPDVDPPRPADAAGTRRPGDALPRCASGARLTPVIMMSGKAQLTDAVRAIKLGAFQFLEKPLTPEAVLVDGPRRAGASTEPGRRTGRSRPSWRRRAN